MKRFVSLLLVAMLVVSSFATVGFAAGTGSISANDKTADRGDTVDVKVTVKSEDGFANFELYVKVADPLKIVGYSDNVVMNTSTGKVAWAAAANKTSVSFTVSIKVSDSAEYGKSYPVDVQNLFVSDENLADLEISVDDGSVTIKCSDHSWNDWVVETEPDCTKKGLKYHICSKCGEKEYADIPAKGHSWGEWKTDEEATCVKEGLKSRVCKVCGEVDKETIPFAEHVWSTEWDHDNENHWHVCTVCGEKTDVAAHTPDPEEGWGADEVNHWHVCSVCEHAFGVEEHTEPLYWDVVKEPTAKEEGLEEKRCEKCGALLKTQPIPATGNPTDPVPGTGDPTGTLMVIGGMSLLLLLLLAVALYMIKRKTSAK